MGIGIQETAAEPVAAERGSAAQGRIPFLLRIGVTGHRNLTEDEALRTAVEQALELAISASGYVKGEGHTPLALTAVSALAEGADRLIARQVLEEWKGSSLVCVLPVAEKDLAVYRADFKSAGSTEDFEKLRARAWRQIEPPPEHASAYASPEQRDAGYLWAGQEVARNSDVIIAIWDDQPFRGKGGTADLIRWLRAHDAENGPEDDADEPALEEVWPLRIIVHVGGDGEPYAEVDNAPPYNAAAQAAQKRLREDLAGLHDFNHKHYQPADWQQRADQVMDDLMPPGYRQWPRLKGILEQVAPPLARADERAIAARRAFIWSSYALFGFTALATILAALQAIVLTGTWELTVGELALIIASVIIVAAETLWKNNNKHWFAYRYLAERLRTACYLLAAGCLPNTDFDLGGTLEEPTQNGWVQRAFTAVLSEDKPAHKAAPEDPDTLNGLIRKYWIAGQLSYFERTSRKMMWRHHLVKGILYGALGATIIAAFLHSLRMWSFHSGDTQALIMCAIGLPAAAGALSNVRSLREFSRHAFRYSRMAAIMRSYLKKFGEESSIEDLGQLAEKAGALLTAETRGWLIEVSGHNLEIDG